MELRILVVEDDPELRSRLRRDLEDEGFAVTLAGDGAGALRAAAATSTPDVFVMNVGLPDADARDVCQTLRARGQVAPVLFLVAPETLSDRGPGVETGDDCLTKPFTFPELLARVRSLLHGTGAGGAAVLGDARLDPTSHALVSESGDQRVALTPTEFRLLATLARSDGDAVRRRDLVREAWPAGATVNPNTLDVYIARVRRKLRSLPGTPRISTLHGVGYRLS